MQSHYRVPITMIFSIAAIELLLRALSPYPLPLQNGAPHATLVWTADPRFPDIDVDGFRNKNRITKIGHQTPIWAIGDSFTYGYNVNSAQSWPSILQESIGVAVINKGIGGYNFLHHYTLANLALAAGSDAIIAIYLGNDLLQGVCEVGTRSFWTALLAARSIDLACPAFQSTTISPAATTFKKSPLPNGLGNSRVVALLVRNSAALNILFHHAWPPFIASKLLRRLDGRSSREQRENFGNNQIRVEVGHPNFIDLAIRSMDLGSPAIHTKFMASTKLYLELFRKFQAVNRKLGFILIRTKPFVEFVAHEDLCDGNKRAVYYHDIEQNLANSYLDFFSNWKIPAKDTIDATIKFRKQSILTGEPFWPTTDDHPLALGYRAYATTARELVETW